MVYAICNNMDIYMIIPSKHVSDMSYIKKLCIAIDCMLGSQPKHGWQLSFPL